MVNSDMLRYVGSSHSSLLALHAGLPRVLGIHMVGKMAGAVPHEAALLP